MKKYYAVYTSDSHFIDNQGNPIFLLGTFDSLAIADTWRKDEYWYLNTYIEEIIIID
jgi:hypothetical protein